MKRFVFGRYVLSGFFVAAMLGGCGALPVSLSKGQDDTQPAIGEPGAVAQRRATATHAGSWMLTVLHRFKGSPHDGAGPAGSLTALRGELYGATGDGGANFSGTVFAISTSGKEHVVYSFNKKRDGLVPFAGVIPVQDALYGTTFLGGTSDRGTIFSLTTSGKEHVLHSFKGVNGTHESEKSNDDGSNPNASLVAVNDVLYGTTQDGGSSGSPCGDGCGTVFSFDLVSSHESIVYRFKGHVEGKDPVGLIAADGKLYGITLAGGTNGCAAQGCGTVFEINASGQQRTLYRFKGGTDGAEPVSLVELNGSLYGVTWEGGASTCSNGTMVVGCGTIFEIDGSGKKKTVYSFQGRPDAALPNDLIAVNGTLYGATSSGGAKNRGTIFEVGASGKESVLVSFGVPHGGAPHGLFALNGALYGATGAGGVHDCYTYHELSPCGLIFSFRR